jgi:hypothetical protein
MFLSDRWLSTAKLADYLDISRDWVYEHATDLGAIRLGSGPRARLRFHLGTVLERLSACSASRESAAPQTRTVERNRRASKPAGLGSEIPLLPVRGRPPGR